MARRDWTRSPEAVEIFSSYCAPTALAGLMECSRQEAAELLLSVPGMTNPRFKGSVSSVSWKGFLLHQLGGELISGRYEGEEYEARCAEYRASYERRLAKYKAAGGWRSGKREPQPTSYADLRMMTVAEFLRRNPTGTFIIAVSGHTLLAKNGRVTDDTLRTKSMRRRVEWGIRFDHAPSGVGRAVQTSV